MICHTFPDSSITGRCDQCGLQWISFISELSNCLKNSQFAEFTCPNKMMFSCCGGSGAAKWDQSNQTWNCSDCGATQSTDASYLHNGRNPPKEDQLQFFKPKVCECGADKVYGPGSGMHSATMPCPLYKKA
jgi:hypothetical protein